jgi:2,4-dienoyl-CoA reductase-like NADH-dependent reductase (Old Yellow Enzyme family)
VDALSQSFKMRCGLEIAGRVAMAPLTNRQSHDDGTLGDDEYRWLVRRAADGFPWVSTCAAYVSDEGKAWQGQLGIARASHMAGMTRLAQGLSAAGAKAIVQLHHAGAKADQAPVRLSTAEVEGSRAATHADLARVREDFVAAAHRAERAGFAGVEIHGANGYLFTQFLAPADNPRTDAYGGDLEGRARFLRETVRAVRAAVAPGFAVGVRLSPVDVWAPRGLVLEDGVQVAVWMADDGVDFVHCSLSDAGGPSPATPDGPPVATAMRGALPADVALLCAGGIWTRADGLRALRAGADFAVLGRASIAHPDWPRASIDPDFEPVRPTWTTAHLTAADVGPALLSYLGRMPGMVEGGLPPRG